MKIQCPNPECRADNPVGAKFCRKCGTAFTPTNGFKQMFCSAIAKLFAKSPTVGASTFTLDTFRNISFQPVSVVKIRFVNRLVVFLFILFAFFWFTTIIHTFFGLSSHDSDEIYIAGLGFLVIAGLCATFIFKWWIKKLRYKLNADYIEGHFINSEIVRIARNSRMGLFDKRKKKVLLSSNYSNIEKFDNQHLLISKGNKKGLYSLTYRKIIVPVMYDSISHFTNSITSAIVQGTEHHYDVKGNELR